MIEISELALDENLGNGIELLMNDKVIKEKTLGDNIHYDDLSQLEKELNDYSTETREKEKEKEDTPSVRFHFNEEPSSQDKTWDGFTKINQIPLHQGGGGSIKEETLQEKFRYLRKLETLEKKGVELSKKYTMESSFTEMKCEYDTIMDEKSKQSSIKFQGDMLKMFIQGIERINGTFDPFGINLDGWSDQVEENINDYDDVFNQLYEKYKSKATIMPELKLLLQLGGSASFIAFSNIYFKNSSIPIH